MLRVVKLILFHILLSFRGLILIASKLLSIACLCGLFLVMSISELNHIPMSAKITLLTCGIIFTSICWFYDYLILYLKRVIIRVPISSEKRHDVAIKGENDSYS